MNYDWLRDVGQISVPDLIHRDGRDLVFAHVDGHHPAPADLPDLAVALARFHVEAHRKLAGAAMNEPHPTTSGLTIPGFSHRREQRLIELLAAPNPPRTRLTAEAVRAWISHADALPPAVYKDTNLRNILIDQGSKPVNVDFDTLTLAPFGYDLAKLIVSAVMTYGSLATGTIGEMLDRYNVFLSQAALRPCAKDEFTAWIEMHHILTFPYLGRNGYRYSWIEVSAWHY
ncbi:aminoglycoside phosphotransferase family protein [Actinocorallia longicatena]|uniref:aminoglycoside phosphotransferase family protein n=1 Tax=Actinocorallia longicatena TaxID=111803 RepID=UPI0031D85C1F